MLSEAHRITPRMREPGNATRAGETTESPGPSQPSSSKAPKLRDSCDACSASKVRCTRQKPTCSRCEKRRHNCEYTATKRAGRPSQASTKSVTKGVGSSGGSRQNDASLSPLSSVEAISPKEVLFSSLNLVGSSPEQGHMAMYKDSLPNLLASTYSTSSTPSSLATFNNDFDDIFASFRPLPERHISAQDILSIPHGIDAASNAMDCRDSAFMPEDPFSTCEDAWSEMHKLPTGPPSIIGNVKSVQSLCSNPPCGCLANAQGFLQELVPNTSKAGVLLNNQTIEDTQALFTIIRSVIVENERMVEAIDNILHCPCSRDGYLLALLSIVVFKVLDLYGSATQVARTVTMTDRYMSHQPVGGLFVDSEGSGRAAAQMIHTELHRTQRLVNTLSARFKLYAMGGSGAENLASGHMDAVDIPCERDGVWPFSTTILYSLESDLRWRLRTVSSRLMDILRYS